MIEYSEILAETIANLKMDYTDAEVLDKFDVLNKINAAQRSILRLAPISQVDNILKTVTGDLQINVPTMAWPSDYVRVSKLFVDYLTTISNTNPGVEATMAEKGTFQTRSLDQRPSKQYP